MVGKTCDLVYNVLVMLRMHFMTKQKKSNRTAACLKMAGADMEVMI